MSQAVLRFCPNGFSPKRLVTCEKCNNLAELLTNLLLEEDEGEDITVVIEII